MLERVHLHAGPGADGDDQRRRRARRRKSTSRRTTSARTTNRSAPGRTQPLFDANNSDDVIFGGWDDDFLHGGAGDDAIGGGEALGVRGTSGTCSTSRRPANADRPDLHRLDAAVQPGQPAPLRRRHDPWHAHKPFEPRLGEFFLYDEYDPRRAILFNATARRGAALRSRTAATPAPAAPTGAARTSSSSTSTQIDAATASPRRLAARQPAANCTGRPSTTQHRRQRRRSSATSATTGWSAAPGRTRIYGGWGNDLLNADDDLHCYRRHDGTATTRTPDDAPRRLRGPRLRRRRHRHPDRQHRRRPPDRLGRRVQQYLVPFAPFGIATVSRQVEPLLPEFLYALSRSHGADPTRDYDTGAEHAPAATASTRASSA